MKSPDRGDSVETPTWWLELASAAVPAHGRTLEALGVELGKAIGRSRPWDHGAMSRYLRGMGPTRQWCEAMTIVLGVPRVYFTPRTVTEAIEMQAISRRHDAPRMPPGLSERSAASVEHADSVLAGLHDDTRRLRGEVKRDPEADEVRRHRQRASGIPRRRTPSSRS